MFDDSFLPPPKVDTLQASLAVLANLSRHPDTAKFDFLLLKNMLDMS